MKHMLTPCNTPATFLRNALAMILLVFSVAVLSGQGTEWMEPDIVCVKLLDNAPITVSNGRLLSHSDKVASEIAELNLLGQFRKLIDLDDAILDEMRETAIVYWTKEGLAGLEGTGAYVADLNRYFILTLPDQSVMHEVLSRLNRHALVDYASRMPRYAMPPAPGNYTGYQSYASNNYGIHAQAVQSSFGIFGSGVRIVDIEGAFNSNHADLPTIPLVNGTYQDLTYGDNHGTAVLGEMVSRNNGWGTTGLAPSATPRFAGHKDAYGKHNLANAILKSVNATSAGDVILLEVHYPGPYSSANQTNQYGYLPAEHYKFHYDAIKVAVGYNRIVVEAAGNGSQNLGYGANYKGYNNHYPYSSSNHSGAIMVGAGHAAPGGTGTPRSRMSFSNYGTRLDLQGFGEKVWTTGDGDAYSSQGKNYWYTANFGGTSSASPIVASAALLVQSAYKSKKNGAVLSPVQLRNLLVNTGQSQTSGSYPSSQKIGPLPNAYSAIASFWPSTSCNAPASNQITTSNITTSSVKLVCNVSGVEAYDWAYRKSGSTSWISLPAASSNYHQLTGLSSGTTYEFKVAVRCNSSTWSAWSSVKSFTTSSSSGNSPSYDWACQGKSLPVSSWCSTVSGTTVGATSSYNGTICGTYAPKDVWFKATIPSSGYVTFRTYAGTLDDAVMAVYWGSCSDLKYITCEDDNTNGNDSYMPVIAIQGTPGTLLLIRVWGYDNAAGTFSICAMDYVTSNKSSEGMPEVVHIDDGSISTFPRHQDEDLRNPDLSDNHDVQTDLTWGIPYPNPAQDMVRIKVSQPAGNYRSFILINALGQRFDIPDARWDDHSQEWIIHLPDVEDGLYFLGTGLDKAIPIIIQN